MLKALGEYQINLFDKMKGSIDPTSKSSLKSESDRVTTAIKKIHHMMEESVKS